MSYALRAPRSFTAAEYLLVERGAADKSEFLDGMIYDMAGTSERHITININLAALVHAQLRGSNCRAFGNDMKVRTASEGFFAYPDLSIVCGERKYHDTANDVLLNPAVILEILSPSTESYDRGEKFVRYQQIDSLTDYVLVAQSAPSVEHWARQENGVWMPSLTYGVTASLILQSVGVTVSLSEVYEDVDF